MDCSSSSSESTTRSAVLALLLEQRSSLFAFIFSMLRDYEAAEDVFQEVSIAICESHEDFQPGTNFGAWAREIARRRVLANRRTAARFPKTLSEESLDKLQAGFDRACAEGAPEPKTRVRALRRCLEQLGAFARKLLKLRYQDELSTEDLGQRTGRRPESVRKALYRTRRALRECIERRIESERR